MRWNYITRTPVPQQWDNVIRSCRRYASINMMFASSDQWNTENIKLDGNYIKKKKKLISESSYVSAYLLYIRVLSYGVTLNSPYTDLMYYVSCLTNKQNSKNWMAPIAQRSCCEKSKSARYPNLERRETSKATQSNFVEAFISTLCEWCTSNEEKFIGWNVRGGLCQMWLAYCIDVYVSRSAVTGSEKERAMPNVLTS